MGSGRMGGLGGALFGCCWEVVRTGGVDLKCLVASQFPDTANTGRVWLLLQADRRGSSPLGERLSVDPPWSSGRAACSAQKALSAAIAARVRPCLPHTSTDFGTAADRAGPVRRRRARIRVVQAPFLSWPELVRAALRRRLCPPAAKLQSSRATPCTGRAGCAPGPAWHERLSTPR